MKKNNLTIVSSFSWLALIVISACSGINITLTNGDADDSAGDQTAPGGSPTTPPASGPSYLVGTRNPFSSGSITWPSTANFRLATVNGPNGGTAPSVVAGTAYHSTVDDVTAQGEWSYASNIVSFSRPQRTVCASGSLPECGAVSTNYANTNYNFYLNSNQMTAPLNKIVSITTQIKQVILTGQGESYCGISFGFGDNNSGQSDPAKTLSFKPGRINDQFRFLYSAKNGSAPNGGGTQPGWLAADILMNNSNNTGGGYSDYNAASWSGAATFRLNATALSAHGQYVEYEMKIEPNTAAGKIKVTLSPMDVDGDTTISSAGNAGWVSQFADWDYTAAATTGAANPRGIAFDVGPAPISRTEFENADVAIGLVANGRSKLCEFRNLSIVTQ